MNELPRFFSSPPPAERWLPAPANRVFPSIPASGQLALASALRLLGRLTMAQAEGQLLLENEGGRLGFVFRGGRLEATQSTWLEDTCERWLLAEGLLAPLELEAPGFNMEQWLSRQLASGQMEAALLLRCLNGVTQQVLRRAMLWTQGLYVWQEAWPKASPPLVSMEDNWGLFLSAARALPPSFLEQRLKEVWALPWKGGPHAAYAENLPWEEAEFEAIGHLRFCGIPAKALQHGATLGLYGVTAFVLWQAEIWVPDEGLSPTSSGEGDRGLFPPPTEAEPSLACAAPQPLSKTTSKLFSLPADPPLAFYAEPSPTPLEFSLELPPPSPGAFVEKPLSKTTAKLFSLPEEPSPAETLWEERLRATKKAWEKENAFSILGLSKEAKGPEIKRAYFALVRQFHPDKLPPQAAENTKRLATELFAQLGEAYRCLSDEEARKALLLKLAGGAEEEEKVGLEALFAAEALFKKAARMVGSRRFAEALPLLQEALKLNPGSAECWAYAGYTKRFIFGYGEKAALVDLEKAKQQNPAFADTYYFLGRLAKLRKEAAAAKKLFIQCLALAPGHIEAQRELRLLTGPKARPRA